MIVSMQEMLQDASRRNYALGSFATPTPDYMKAITEAAEELNAPVIMMIAQRQQNDIDYVAPLMHQFAQRVRVPIALHIDHALTIDYAVQGVAHGFNSIMFDQAALPFEENIKSTKEFVDFAHKAGVAVEGEIGHMPSNVVGQGGCDEFGKPIVNIRDYFTKVEEVGEYVDRTGVDLLTVSFGTVHGILVEEVNLDIDLLKKINAATDCPLVMHGASGTPDDQMKASIDYGINKVNFHTGMSKPVLDYIVGMIQDASGMPPYYYTVQREAENLIKEIVKERILFYRNGVPL